MKRNCCNRCGKKTIRIDAVDADACIGCDLWKSKPCGGAYVPFNPKVPWESCTYCKELRKYAKPSDVPKEWLTDPRNT